MLAKDRWVCGTEKARLVNVALLGILALALLLRSQRLVAIAESPLDPDAATVVSIAAGMRHPYDTQFREPLWIWFAKPFSLIFGAYDIHIRYFSLTLSMVYLYCAFRFIHDYTRRSGLALLTTLFLALNGYLVFLSVRGLRIELYMVTLTMFCYYVFVRAIPLRARLVGLSVWTSLVSLTQLTGLVMALPLLGWATWRHRLPLRSIVIVLGTTAVLLAPHLINNLKQYGDPLWSTNVHAVWYRNYEYLAVKKTGCDGCPPLDIYSRDSYSGRRISMVQYVFGMHSPNEVLSRIGSGYTSLYLRTGALLRHYLGTPSGTAAWMGQFLYFIGLVGLAAGPFRELLLVPLLGINLLAFVIPLGVDPRLLVHTAWFGALAMALPVRAVLVKAPALFQGIGRWGATWLSKETSRLDR